MPTKIRKTKVGKIQRQILENIRDRNICPTDKTHLGRDGQLVGVPSRQGKTEDSDPYNDLAYHRRAVKKLLERGFIEEMKTGYRLTAKSPVSASKLYLSQFEDFWGDQHWVAARHGFKRDAVISAKDTAYQRKWTFSGAELITASTFKRLLDEVKASRPVAQQKIIAILDAMPLSIYTVHGLNFRRTDDDGINCWSTVFDGDRYMLWQPPGCTHWIVSIQLLQAGSPEGWNPMPLNLGLMKNGQVQLESGPLFIHGGTEPSDLFWMTYLAEYLNASHLYSIRKSIVDRLHDGDQVPVNELLSLNLCVEAKVCETS
jgi:hypothetical protein